MEEDGGDRVGEVAAVDGDGAVAAAAWWRKRRRRRNVVVEGVIGRVCERE